ncbi:MAG: CPBP family intramembrane glutamic endopeptidase [Pirellulales bacterium]
MKAALTTYLEDSAQPFTSLLFVTPLLIVYELGLWLAADDQARNAADQWLRSGMAELGFSGLLLLPLITVSSLLAWHHISHRQWTFPPQVLGGMYVESCLFAATLLAFASCWTWDDPAAAMHAVNSHATSTSLATPQLAAGQVPAVGAGLSAAPGAERWALLVTYLGAGIYEEVLFRLLLLSALAGLALAAGLERPVAGALAIGISSFFFALAHYQTLVPAGEVLEANSFQFRLAAGLFFGILFWNRGFGITVGTHAIYDLMVGLQQI